MAEEFDEVVLSPGAMAVILERARQMEVEGHEESHDDEWTQGQLARAAATYALPEATVSVGGSEYDLRKVIWPWPREWFKPGDGSVGGRIRELEKAGALIVAEIDRLLRLQAGLRGDVHDDVGA